MKFKPSEYQELIFDYIKNEKGNVCIEALAGSGKSSTLVECADLIGYGNNLFVAFNKSIQKELSHKLEHTTMKATTLHALGYSLIMRYIAKGRKVEVDMKKVGNIMNKLKLGIGYKDFMTYINIVKAIKSFKIDYSNEQELLELFEYLNIGDKYNDIFYKNINRIMNESNNQILTIDFEDMIYLPLIKKVDKMPKDWIFVDETQDLCDAQLELIDLFIGNETRCVFVGDQQQGIYGFRFASLTIMHDIIVRYNCKTFQLPITYRCPKSHIQLVKKHVPNIEAYSENGDGVIEREDYNNLPMVMEDNAVYLARTNKFVIETVLMLLKNKRKATTYGKDIAKNIKNQIKKFKCVDMQTFKTKVMTKLYDIGRNIREYESKIKFEHDMNNIFIYKKRIKQLNFEYDLFDTITVLINECTTLRELDKLIEDIFSDNIKGIVCSTIHKMKGMEFDNVYVMQNKLPMLYKNQTDDDIQQEMNIHYVAHTRSKNKIVLVTKKEK